MVKGNGLKSQLSAEKKTNVVSNTECPIGLACPGSIQQISFVCKVCLPLLVERMRLLMGCYAVQ